MVTITDLKKNPKQGKLCSLQEKYQNEMGIRNLSRTALCYQGFKP